MKRNKFKLALLFSLIIYFNGFSTIYLYNNTNLLKGSVVENLENFSKELKSSAWDWTTTEVVSTESTGKSLRPTIAVDGSGNVHTTWYDETNYGGSWVDNDIFYKRWNAAMAAWTTTEVVSTESTGDSLYPTIAADISGNVHIAWQDETNYGGSGTDQDIFYKRWNPTTAAWTTTEVVSTESTDDSYFPTIAADISGNVHIVWEDKTDYSGSGMDRDIFYKRWNVNTAVWTTTEVISTESTEYASFPTLIVDDIGNIHIAWEDITGWGPWYMGCDISYKRWDVSMVVWTTTEVVSTESTGYSKKPTIAADISGNVHVAWQDDTNYGGSGMDQDIFYKRWNGGSESWTTTEVVSTESTSGSDHVTIAADISGNVHIAWQDYTNYGGSGTDSDIYYKRWNSTMAAWTTTEVVSTESTDVSNHPTIAADISGNVHIAWQDYTNYGGSGMDQDIFYKKLASTPLNPSIIINNGDASTNSTLVNLTLSSDLAKEMCFKNGTIGAWSSWEPYATVKQLYLEGSINNTVYSIYVKFRNVIGETSPVGDSILYLIFTPIGNFQSPIHIDDSPASPIDWAWAETQPWCSGSGTFSDPYVIDGLNITARGVGNGILIENSYKYFIVQNCKLIESGSGTYDAGIHLDRVGNGTLINNNCSFNNNAGIILYHSCFNNTISGNYLTQNIFISVWLRYSDNNNILDNKIVDNFDYGIHLYHCDNNTIDDNEIINNSVGIRIHASEDNNVTNNDFFDNSYGISLRFGHNTKIFSNNISGNNNGIYNDNTRYLEVSENTIENSVNDGIRIHDVSADNNMIYANDIKFNGRYGIFIDDAGCQDNKIYLNNFNDNNVNAYDNGTDNNWNSSIIGNYWEDYDGIDANDDGIGDTPYLISGIGEGQDNYPIWDDGDDIAPVITIISPLLNSIFSLDAPSYQITIVELNLDTIWYTLDGGETNYTVTSLTGTFNQLAWGDLSEGSVTISFYANDTVGNIGFIDVGVIIEIPEDLDDLPGISFGNYYLIFTFITILSFIILEKRKKKKL